MWRNFAWDGVFYTYSMSSFFAYVRVSTSRQGSGVSLLEQRIAIERFARREGLSIRSWFEERETAAKRGRPVFQEMLKRLTAGEAQGLLIHKIDRGARNLRDWADLGELIDGGIDVRFVHDKLDLETRGGRLAADIQAVVAADFIRNLREEVKKGLEGRLRQGLYPARAPLGYLDMGAGKPKAVDPSTAPFVVEAFERYAKGTTLSALSQELGERGFRNRSGRRVTINNLAHVLHNPFYAGIVRFRNDERPFKGRHEALVTEDLFRRVQAQFASRRGHKERGRHLFTYRRLVRCTCGRFLIGERRKGHTYYRCHGCKGVCVREEALNRSVQDAFSAFGNLSLANAFEYAGMRERQALLRGFADRCTFSDNALEVTFR